MTTERKKISEEILIRLSEAYGMLQLEKSRLIKELMIADQRIKEVQKELEKRRVKHD